MNRKQFQCKDIKIEDEGKIKLVFGTMNVIDHDGDVTTSGAIGEPQKVRMSAYNHSSWMDALPVGKGIVYESGNDMIFEGRFFLNTDAGRQTYETVKAMEDLQEYSYGFDITEAGYGKFEDRDVRFLKGLKIYEVSPVLLGAGVDTRTLDVKALSKQITDDMKQAAQDAGEDTDADSDDGADSKTYAEHAELLLNTVNEFVKRSQSIAGLREEKGKAPASEKNHERLADIAKALAEAASVLERLTKDPDEEVAHEAALLLEQFEIKELMRST